jgi:hypothetical protein
VDVLGQLYVGKKQNELDNLLNLPRYSQYENEQPLGTDAEAS